MQKKDKQNPLIGISIVFIFLFIAFGIPFVIMTTGIATNTFIQGLFLNIVFILINLGLYKYRKSIKYETKKYYDLTIKDEVYESEKKYRNSDLKLTNEIIHYQENNSSIDENILTEIHPENRSQNKQEVLPKKIVLENQVLYDQINNYDQQVKIKEYHYKTPIESRHKFCSKCGTALNVEDVFCKHCGSKIARRDK